MTKPVVVEKIENMPGVLHTDTEKWTRGPVADREPQIERPASNVAESEPDATKNP